MDRVVIRIFDRDLNFLGEVDAFTSFFYIRKWHACSEFQFKLSKVNSIIQEDYRIMVNNDPYRSGIIKYINIDEYETEEVTVKGFCLRYLFADRNIWPEPGQDYDVYNVEIENIMHGLVTKNAINPTNTNRKYPHMVASASLNRGGVLTFQSTYKPLADELESLSESSGLGTAVKLDAQNKQEIFEVLEGIDRTYDNGVNQPYIFSRKFDNIVKRSYTKSNIGHKNMAIVGGQGEGADREIVLINDDLAGYDRREGFIDARDISKDSETTLADRGAVKLAEYPETLSFEAEVLARDYHTMWDLGDIVTIIDDEVGIIQNPRIIEVKETYETGGIKIEPTFGQPLLTIQKKIKQMVANSTNAPGVSPTTTRHFIDGFPPNPVSGMTVYFDDVQEMWRFTKGEWLLFGNGIQTKITINSTEPTNPVIGDVWIG